MTQVSPTPTAPITDLWREARAWLAEAMREFHGPAEIARAVERAARAAVKRRLVMIESFVMKLLLIEAASAHPPDARDARWCGPRAERRFRSAHAEDPLSAETWRVRFRFRIPPEPRRERRPGAGRPARLTFKPGAEAAQARARAQARYLARRFEALRRVLADPRRAIKRLALRLHALGRAARAVARRIALARPPRLQSLGPAFADAMVRACDVSLSFPADTS